MKIGSIPLDYQWAVGKEFMCTLCVYVGLSAYECEPNFNNL